MAEPAEYITRQHALRSGSSDVRIHRSVKDGSLTRIGTGALIDSGSWAQMNATDQYRLKVRVAAERCSTGAVVSHESAAVLHGLGILHPRFDSVHFSEHGRGGGHGGARVLHRVPLAPEDITVVDGVVVTALARTALDVACSGSFEQALCVVESAMRMGVSEVELQAALQRMGRRRGIGVARSAVHAADGRTESVGESWSRALMLGWPDIPEPRLQHEFRSPEGYFVARSDFDWDGKLDGVVKFRDNAHDALLAERRRERRLLDLGVHVVRWDWDDLRRPDYLHRMLVDGLRRVGLL